MKNMKVEIRLQTEAGTEAAVRKLFTDFLKDMTRGPIAMPDPHGVLDIKLSPATGIEPDDTHRVLIQGPESHESKTWSLKPFNKHVRRSEEMSKKALRAISEGTPIDKIFTDMRKLDALR